MLKEQTTEATMRVRAFQLVAGDRLSATGGIVERIVRKGLYMRDFADRPTKTLFPTGKVEVMVSYPGRAPRVDYWNAGTVVEINNR